jgi:Fe-S-cluster-containing hydrogenase component 2
MDHNSQTRSLNQGHWFKLICGASFQHLPAIRTLSLVYALAGADCIDVAADPAIISIAREALAIAHQLSDQARDRGFTPSTPWLMVSLNDGEDPHFRKAEFNPEHCPPDCPRPCETICPADAIDHSGVIDDRCYGCGRCVPLCPIEQIITRSYVYAPEVISPMLLQSGIDAIEIQTQIGRIDDFNRIWNTIAPRIEQLKLISISCPDGDGLIDYLRSLHELITPLPCALIWQTDGRPMSGDIGDGATRACVKLGQKVLATDIPGHIQLAGGTNRHTVPKLESVGMLQNRESRRTSRSISGLAYGSYARSLLSPVLTQLDAMEIPPLNIRSHPHTIETAPDLLWQAVSLASELVHQIKSPNRVLQVI